MKTEDFDKTKEELKEEIKKNNKQIAISDERTRMAFVNQFEYKGMLTVAFSMIPYLALMILIGIQVENGSIASLTSTIPGEAFPFIITGGSLCLGTIGRKLLESKYNTNERLKSYTNARTQAEKLEEEVKNTIELEKAKNRNKAIQQTIDSLSSNQSILNSLSNKYSISDKTAPPTKEEAQKNIKELSKLLKRRNDELDLLTTQKVLHEKFWKVRNQWQKVMEMIMAPMLGGALTMMYSDMPLVYIRDSLTFSPLQSLLSIFAPFIAGSVGVGAYKLKKNKDSKKIFNNLNSELGKNALPDKIKEAYEEQQDIDAKIESKIREISTVGIQLQEQKRALESFIDDENQSKIISESSESKEHEIQDTKESSFENSYTENDLFDLDLPIDEDKDKKEEEKGPSLVLRRNPYNPNNNK